MKSKMVWLIAILMVHVNLVQADENSLKGSWNGTCDKFSLGKQEEILSQSLANLQLIKKQLSNSVNLIQNIKENGAEQAYKLLYSFKDFALSSFKITLIGCFFLFIYIFVTQRGQYFNKISFVHNNSLVLQNIHSKVKAIAVIMLVVSVLIIFYSAFQALFIISNRETPYSELQCLIDSGPKLRINEGGLQKWINLDEVIQLLASKQVYFEENPLQLALFVDYRLDMEQNLRVAQLIRGYIIESKAQQIYLEQIDSFIKTLKLLTKLQQITKTYDLKQIFQKHYSFYVEGSKILSIIHKKIFQTKIGEFFSKFQLILLSFAIVSGLVIIYILIKNRQGSNNHNKYINLMRNLIIWLLFLCFVVFIVTSIIVSGVYWIDKGFIRYIENNQLTKKIESIQIFGDLLIRFLPNSRQGTEVIRNNIIVEARKYYELISPLAQKDNDYYYGFFKQTLSYLTEPAKQKMIFQLQRPHIKHSALVSQTRIARDAFYRMITTLDANNILNRIQFADYGRYLLKITASFKNITYTNTYTLRKYYGYMFNAYLFIYFLSFLSFTHDKDNKNSSQKLPQAQIFEDPESQEMIIYEEK